MQMIMAALRGDWRSRAGFRLLCLLCFVTRLVWEHVHSCSGWRRRRAGVASKHKAPQTVNESRRQVEMFASSLPGSCFLVHKAVRGRLGKVVILKPEI